MAELQQMSKSDVMVAKTFSAKFLVILMMTACGCYMAVRGIAIDNQFSTLWGVIVTYYFGKNEFSEKVKPKDDAKPE